MKKRNVLSALALCLFTAACAENHRHQHVNYVQSNAEGGNFGPMFEGAGSSGGGKGVVCRDANGRIAGKVKVLDLWEASIVYGLEARESEEPIRQQVMRALTGLSQVVATSNFETLELPNNQILRRSERVLHDLNQFAESWISAFEVRTQGTFGGFVFLRNVQLTQTPDSYEVVRPAGNCRIEQIVNYQDAEQRVYINQDLTLEMSKTQLSGLIAHEIFYKWLRRNSRENNSVRVRRAVGQVFAGRQARELTLPETGYYECRSGVLARDFSHVLIYPRLVQGTSSDRPFWAVIPISIAGVRALGVEGSLSSTRFTRESGLFDIFSGTEFEAVPSYQSRIDIATRFTLKLLRKEGQRRAEIKLTMADGTSELMGPVEMRCHWEPGTLRTPPDVSAAP